MTPSSGWNIMTKIRAMATGVATIGRIARVRKRPRPQNWRLNSSASVTPRNVWTVTPRMVK